MSNQRERSPLVTEAIGFATDYANPHTHLVEHAPKFAVLSAATLLALATDKWIFSQIPGDIHGAPLAIAATYVAATLVDTTIDRADAYTEQEQPRAAAAAVVVGNIATLGTSIGTYLASKALDAPWLIQAATNVVTTVGGVVSSFAIVAGGISYHRHGKAKA
jgi:hypothetical protein